ncbi:MAG: ABC transporter permease [Christensenella sp.]|uniref:ABC transporter permease n=1 Tax=Christensenella sp. TaxID=1935934 RepID=UPI002B218505|nr:ABC transporter permease [Christensenella sp.]MEA5002697.1 ABC transporter permease [Christensenella sp.]
MLLQSIKMAFSAIAASKMRSFLTMLGIIIGVIALVVLVSIVSSATSSITEQVESMGNDMLSVSIMDDKENPIKLSELTALQNEDVIGEVAPSAQINATAKHGYNDETATVYGTNAAYYDIQGLTLGQGRFLKTTDVDNSSYVAVLSNELATNLFGSADALGETVSLNGRNFQVVGVLEKSDSIMASLMGNSQAYIPFSVATRMSDSGAGITGFYVSASEPDRLNEAEDTVNSIMMNRLKQDEDAFSIMNSSIIADTMGNITGILTLVLGGIAAISLLVGGIGIMNIMLVSVTERTREIGIRKAIGASRGSILSQFLVESLVLSLLGCLIGVALSWVIIEIASVVASAYLTFQMSGGVVLIAVVFSVAIGVLFGIYPANKAAKKNPIEALRYEG